MVDHETLNLVGDVFEAVDDLFEVAVDFAADDEVHRIGLAVRLEQRLDAGIMDIVGITFDLDEARGQIVQPRCWGRARAAAEWLRR